MGKKLYVGGLPYKTTEAELQELFAAIGEVEKATIITDRETGNSKGFGFVEMVTEEDAVKAIEALNNTEYEGRKLVVNEARPMEERRPSFGGGNGGGQNRFNRNSRY